MPTLYDANGKRCDRYPNTIQTLRNPSEKDLMQIEDMVARGATEGAIAGYFGVSRCTYLARKKEYPIIQESIERGFARGELFVTSQLWKIICDPKSKSHAAALMFWLRARAGWKEIESVKKTVDKPKKAAGRPKLINPED